MNYNSLMNKPTINYRELIGDNTVTEVGGITEEQFNTLLNTDLSSYYTKAQIDNLFSRSYVYREKSGSIVTFDCPSTSQSIPDVTVGIEAVQSGSGDPSPTNVRPISGFSAVNIARCGKNLYPHNGISVYDYAFSQQIAFSQMRNPIFMKGGQKYVLSLSDNITLFRMRAFDKSQNLVTDASIVNAHNQGSGTGLVFYSSGNFFGYNGAGVNSITTFQPTEDIWFDMTVQTTSPSQVMFERGETPSTYEAYNGTTYTTTLKDGQGNPMTCYGGTLDVVSGVLTVTHGYIASYNDETLPSTWISDRDVYAEGTTPTTGAEVVYALATSQQITQDTLSITSIAGINNIWSDSGDITVKALDRIIQG